MSYTKLKRIHVDVTNMQYLIFISNLDFIAK